MVNVREWDDLDDELQTATGALDGLTYGTLAVLVKRLSIGTTDTIVAPHTSGGTGSGLRTEWTEFDDIALRDSAGGTSNVGSQGTANVWRLLVWRKATGSVTPRVSIYNYSTASWQHSPGHAALADGEAPGLSGTIRFGIGQFGGRLHARIAAGAYWSNLVKWSADAAGDAAIAAAGLETAYQNWIDNTPSGAWKFNQAATTTAVVDDTGNGADETSLTGTTVVDDLDLTFDFTLGGGAVQGAAALSASGTLTAAGTATSHAASTLSAGGTLVATGQARSRASAALSAQSTMTAAARVRALGRAALSATGTLTVATGAVRGAASLAATATMTVAAKARALGSAALSGDAAMTTAGTARAQAATALSASSGLTVTGRVRALGRAILSALGTLTASGNLPQAVPPHPEVLDLEAVPDMLTLTAVQDVHTITRGD